MVGSTNKVNPLNWQVPIVNKDGTPTNEFMRKWLQQATTNSDIPGVITTAAEVSALLDLLGDNPGDTLYRGLSEWATLGGASTDGDVLTWDDATGRPKWAPASGGGAGVILGSGPPGSLSAPDGTIYSQTDTAAVWTSHPVSVSAPSVIQSASNSGHSSLPGAPTFGAAPTAGNLLLAFIDTAADITSDLNPAWTIFAHGGGPSTFWGYGCYRYVQPGDSATLPNLCLTGATFWAITVVEVSNMTGTFATDALQFTAVYNQTASSFNTPATPTIGANSLVILGVVNQGVSIAPTNITNPSGGWVNDQQGNDASVFAWLASHLTISSSGTSMGVTIANPTNGENVAITVELAGSSASPHWTLMGGISTALPIAEIIVGDASGVAAPVAMSGDATIDDTGAVTVAKSGGVAFGTAAFTATTAYDAAGAAAAAQAAAEAASDPVGTAAAVAALRTSATVFGLAKVDGTTITEVGGVITAVPSAAPTAPTRQVLTAGTAATYNTPTGAQHLRIRMVGGGGGGSGDNLNSGRAPDGTATSFNSITAAPGKGGATTSANNPNSGNGAGTAAFRAIGSVGGKSAQTLAAQLNASGGHGAASAFGGGASGGWISGAGANAPANSGGGGGGGGGNGTTTTGNSGSGGGAGEYVELIIDSPASTYTYTVGTGGTGGTSGGFGGAGGNGGSGVIIVDEYYG